jgi:hypothetical protein
MKMDEFRKVIKRRQVFSLVFGVAVWVLWFVVISLKISVFQTKFLSVLFVTILMVLHFFNLGLVNRHRAALRDLEELKSLYLYEHDERNTYIRARSSDCTLSIVTHLLTVAAFIAALLSATVFFTLAAVLFVTVILRRVLKSYFAKRL